MYVRKPKALFISASLKLAPYFSACLCWQQWHNSPDVIVTLVPTCWEVHWNS